MELLLLRSGHHSLVWHQGEPACGRGPRLKRLVEPLLQVASAATQSHFEVTMTQSSKEQLLKDIISDYHRVDQQDASHHRRDEERVLQGAGQRAHLRNRSERASKINSPWCGPGSSNPQKRRESTIQIIQTCWIVLPNSIVARVGMRKQSHCYMWPAWSNDASHWGDPSWCSQIDE